MNRVKTILLLFVFSFIFVFGVLFQMNQRDGDVAETEIAPTHLVELSRVEKEIVALEYEITRQSSPLYGTQFQAPNRAHNIRTTFFENGIQLNPRVASDEGWAWGLHLVGYGDGTHSVGVETAVMQVTGNQIAYQRDNITEWYVNNDLGLEQGFTVQSSPVGMSTDVLILDLALSGDLTPHLASDGNSIDFTTAEGSLALRYSGLVAYDADNQTLPSRMMLESTEDGDVLVQLAVETAVAQYPIVIDPLASSADWIAGVTQDANFGFSVSDAGDVNNDGYDDVIVGAHWYDSGTVDSGAVFAYLGSSAGLHLIHDWMVIGGAASAELGFAVNNAGDVNQDGFDDVIVGSKIDRAFVYYGNSTGLDLVPAWTGIGVSGSKYGEAVATAGDVNNDGWDDVLVGAPIAKNMAGTAVGRAYLYFGSNAGPSVGADWIAESDIDNANFGVSVGTAGDVNDDNIDDLIIGADQYAPDGPVGTAVVFYGSSSGPASGGPVASANDWDWQDHGAFENNAQYGHSVSTAGDINGDNIDDVIVGAPNDLNASINAGKAYAYLGSSSGLSTSPIPVTLQGVLINERYGHSVADAGDVNGDGFDDVIIGSPQYTISGTLEGSAAVYLGTNSGTGLLASPSWFLDGDVDNGLFGNSVSGAGDVNGDGFDDLIVGAPTYDGAAFGKGRAFGFYGTGSITGLAAENSSPTEVDTATAFKADITSPESSLNSFYWNFGDGTTGEGQAVLHTYAMPGIYTATVDAINPFNMLSASTRVTVTVDSDITPGGGGQLEYINDDGQGTQVNVPAGAVDQKISLSFTPIMTLSQPSPDHTTKYYFDLDVTPPDKIYLPLVLNESGGGSAVTAVSTNSSSPANTQAPLPASCPVGHFCFEQPVTLTITYVEALLNGQLKEDLTLVFWDEVTQGWIDAATTCSPASTYVRPPGEDFFTIEVCHFSRFGMIGAN